MTFASSYVCIWHAIRYFVLHQCSSGRFLFRQCSMRAHDVVVHLFVWCCECFLHILHVHGRNLAPSAAAAPQTPAITWNSVIRALVREVTVLVTPEAQNGAEVLDPSTTATTIITAAIAIAVIPPGVSGQEATGSPPLQTSALGPGWRGNHDSVRIVFVLSPTTVTSR